MSLLLRIRNLTCVALSVLALVGLPWRVWGDVAADFTREGLVLSLDGARIGPVADWLQVRDLSEDKGFVTVPVSATADGFQGEIAGLAFTGWARADGGMGEIYCALLATPPRDRAVVVKVSLPVAAVGWTWWDDAVAGRSIETGKQYSKVADWSLGRRISMYPFCAITGPQAGVSLAVPLHEPRSFRLTYDAERQRLEAEIDLGLSQDAAKLPARADFRVLAYRHDPKWGFRDALRRYYERYPAYVERRVGEGGIWLLGFAPETMACPWDFGLRFDEGGQWRADYDCAHGILPFVYTECWGKYEHFGARPTLDGKPRYGEEAPLLSAEELRRSVLDDLQAPADQRDRHFGLRREIAQANVNSAIERQDGSWVWRHWTDEWSPGDWISNLTLNPDPDLPKPNRATITWQVELAPAYEVAKSRGGKLAGVYLDSIASFMGFYNENFRRDHWRYADVPLVASFQAKGPAQLHAFACYEFAAQLAEQMKERKEFLIGNTFRPYMQFFCHLLDMIGAGETRSCGLAADEYYQYLRAYGYTKPLSWMDYSFVDPKRPWEDKERGLQRCLFYAVHPGTGSFDNPAAYEPSRPLFRVYEPVITWLDEAGWQPITGAWTDRKDVLVERYGPTRTAAGPVAFVALRNAGAAKVTARVEADLEALGLVEAGEVRGTRPVGWLLLADREAELSAGGTTGRVRTELPMPPDSTEVVALGSREALASLWLKEAQRFLERVAIEADWCAAKGKDKLSNGDFEQKLQGWGLNQPPLARSCEVTVSGDRPLGGKWSLRAVSLGDDASQALHQNLVLAGGRSYRLRFSYRWKRPEGATGTVTPRFGVKGPDGNWAQDQYIYFRDLQPTDGKEATYERVFTVPDEHSTGFFQFLFGGPWGEVEIDDIEVLPETEQQAVDALPTLAETARKAAADWNQRLARMDAAASLRLATAQRETYRRLRETATSLEGEHLRRCLLLPVEDFADCLGRGIEILSGVTLHGPAELPFVDATRGRELLLACRVRADRGAVSGLTVAVQGGAEAEPVSLSLGEEQEVVMPASMPEQAPWGWQDVLVEGVFTQNGQLLWLPRRITARLHPVAEVQGAMPISPVRRSLSLSLQSWLPGAEIKLTAQARVDEREIPFEPVTAKAAVVPGAVQQVELPLPSAFAAAIPELLRAGGKAVVLWRAETTDGGGVEGTIEVPLVAGAACPRLAAAPRVDGRVEAEEADGEWAGAARLEPFLGAADGKPAARPTAVLAGHDGANLYLAFLCWGQTEPQATHSGQDVPVWEDDSVEVFLQPPGSTAYYHLAVNAAGARYDARCQLGLDPSWEGQWQAASGRMDGGWVVEMAVPLKAVGGTASGIWRANFGREEADTGAATCWSPTLGGFHTPARFGELSLGQ